MKSRNLKSILLLGLIILMTNLTYGQVYKLKTTSVAFMTKVNDYQWSDWSEWEETSILVVMDIDKDRFTIYSKETQVYDVAEDEGKTTDSDGDDTWSFYCVNKDGLTCRVRLVKLNSQNGRNQLYVDFNDMKWVYNLYSLD
ncbi:hypothetical protein MG290_08765 [Flavobacterium sp. CBA20B-1]|uniref:hypothetical protein n=1 Tax=unclassified Flavobacterium TaxID=196869 RepID=UPI002224DF45|nr:MULTISPECIES: hypothetical protein [unclassified Flavobacterium]WCM41051.1 hypothetical protein MG290_08765 [Flavobacterium sp. CBA20B-1]